MIKTYTAYTTEVDDTNLAVSQILTQLKPEENLLTNSIGIISCHSEFVLSGVVKALGEALPFDTVGAISTAQSTAGKSDALILSIMLITSDGVQFASAVTPSLTKNAAEEIDATYKKIATSFFARPRLVLAYAPFMTENSGDDYVEILARASYGAPCFGTIATDSSEAFENCFSIYNGEHFRDKMVITLIYGNFKPKFFIANISDDKILHKGAVITKSRGHILMEVNNRPIADFLNDMGLDKFGETRFAMLSLPFLLDYHDGTPKVSKIFVSLTSERHALCAGAVPEGSTMHIAINEREDILSTTGHAMDKILEQSENVAGLLIYSCFSRSVSMGSDIFAELELVNNKVSDLPTLMAYSGGEICPTTNIDDKSINRFHNNAFIACLF